MSDRSPLGYLFSLKLYSQRIPLSDYLEITTAVVVPCGGRTLSLRTSINVIFTLSGSLGIRVPR